MIFNRRAQHEAAVLETVQILLEPLHEILPGLVNRVVQNLSGGRTLALGGQVLLQELVAWRDSVVEQEKQSTLERQEHRLIEIRSMEAQQTKTILALQNKINSLEQGIEKQKLEKEFYQKTIQDQNSIVAEQHERLIALLGHARS
jgi:hypothetical protein